MERLEHILEIQKSMATRLFDEKAAEQIAEQFVAARQFNHVSVHNVTNQHHVTIRYECNLNVDDGVGLVDQVLELSDLAQRRRGGA